MNVRFYSSLIALALASASQTRAGDTPSSYEPGGAVYTMDNAAAGNNVLILNRRSDGTLLPSSSQPTGGLGTGSGLGSQGALLLTQNGQWLLACNAGSDDISVFAVTRNGLHLTDRVSSGGRMPISLSLNERLLYVLNAGGAGGAQDSVTGFNFDRGRFTPLPGSTRALSSDNTGPAEVSFTSDGGVLVVTEKTTSMLDTFTLDRNGLPVEHKIFASPEATPFGFAAGRQNRIYVSNATGSSLSSYEVSAGGDIEVISDAVPTKQNAACWAILTGNNRFAYTANAASGSISGYRVDRDGNLQLLDDDGRTGVTGNGSHPVDMAFSNGSQFLYVLNTSDGTISAFQAGSDGSLQALEKATGIPTSASGLAAR